MRIARGHDVRRRHHRAGPGRRVRAGGPARRHRSDRRLASGRDREWRTAPAPWGDRPAQRRARLRPERRRPHARDPVPRDRHTRHGGGGRVVSVSRSEQGRGPRAEDLRRTTRLFRRYMGGPKVYNIGLALLVLEALTAVVEPYPIAYLVDYLQGARPSLDKLGFPIFVRSERIGTILVLTLAILLIAGVNSAADSLSEVYMARGGRTLGYRLRVAMYSHLQRLPLDYHDTKRTGDVLTRVTGDVLVIEDFIVKSVSVIFGSLLVLVGSFALILYQSWRVATIALVVVPMLALVSNHYSRRIKAASKSQRDREGELASTTQEMLGAIRLVQSYGRGTVDLQRFSTETEQSMHASVRSANIQAQFSFVVAIAEALAISAVVWLGVWL